jgi:membrane-associated phospholipid phosphatase
MGLQLNVKAVAVIVGFSISVAGAGAQTASSMVALQGLAPVTALDKSPSGVAALAGNLAVTGSIQDGTLQQPTLLPFAEQQQQALRDAFITVGNAYGLADGLGSKLGGAYQSLTRYTSTDDGATSSFTSVSPAVARLIAFAMATTGADAVSGKFFFGNATLDGTKPVPDAALAILKTIGGAPDIFGRSYAKPIGSAGADLYGDSRPFQTEPHLTPVTGPDFFGVASGNAAYLNGPTQDLRNSPSYPSGHTTYGYTEALVLALLVPERYTQMVTRAAEYGNDRIILGAHYTMDVLGGRTLALYDMAQLLANKPGYVGEERQKVKVDDFQAALAAARTDLTKALETACGGKIVACAKEDTGRFAKPAKNRAFYQVTQTYGLPPAFADKAKGTEDVGKLAPEAGYLLTAAFPHLTLAEADRILTETEGPGGGFLDDGSAFGIYSRIDLYRAAQSAAAKGRQ